MINVYRLVGGLFGAFFTLMGLRWAFDPSSAAESLGMVLLDGNALSTQIGDLGSFFITCLLYTSPSPRDATLSRMPSSA